MSKFHIVMPCYNHWEMTHERLFELYRKERENISHILIVDDASSDPSVQDGLKWWKNESKLLPLSYIIQSTNQGFLRTVNKGLTEVCVNIDNDPADVVAVISNDVKIMTKFVSQMTSIFSQNPRSLVGGTLLSHDTGWNKFGDRVFPYLEGWLLAATIAGWIEFGFLDELYAPQDFEDVDLSTTAAIKGYELVPLNNPGLVHLGAQTYGYNSEREANTIKNKKKFEEKWIK